jgi:beta-glucuronidase
LGSRTEADRSTRLFNMKYYIFTLFLIVEASSFLMAEPVTVQAQDLRKTLSLNGRWHYIIDPYETGFYDYRFQERRADDPEAYWNTDQQKNKSDRKEHGYSDRYSIDVPGDWNHQKPEFTLYEGTIWYQRTFNYEKVGKKKKYFLEFGAVNYKADVYLNGVKLGMHKGGFTPFKLEIPDSILKTYSNFLVVKVDNKRFADEVPTLNTDWWNYGGITRYVKLLEVPETFIEGFVLQLKKGKPGTEPKVLPDAEGWIKLNHKIKDSVTIDIPELGFKKRFIAINDLISINIRLPKLQLWDTEHPKLYRVVVTAGMDRLEERIGFRTVEAFGKQVLLNGKRVFFRGISIHGEIPQEVRRAVGPNDALQLIGQAKEIGCNMVRLAHYPHDAAITRLTDSLGMLVWSEVPVYWTIDFANPVVFDKAKLQLKEMIARDQNRASIIIWSVGNETPVSPVRTQFMHGLIDVAHQLDSTRLVSAALEVNYAALNHHNVIDDPLGEFVDIVAFNEYLGWYGGFPDNCRSTTWSTPYNKPLFVSETGAEAKSGFHGDSLTRFSEEYQEWFFKEQVAMLKRMPDNYVGISPWVLADFRSPKRNNPLYQEGWNRKGLYDDKGRKKKAFYIIQKYYSEMKAKYR